MYMLPPPFFQREEKKLAPFEKKGSNRIRLWCPLGNGFHRYRFLFYHTSSLMSRKIYPRMFSEGFVSYLANSLFGFLTFLKNVAKVVRIS